MAIQGQQNQSSNQTNPLQGNPGNLDKESKQFAGTQGGAAEEDEMDTPLTGDGDVGVGSQNQTKQNDNLGGKAP